MTSLMDVAIHQVDSDFANPYSVELATAGLLDNSRASAIADLFKMMADPTRVRMLSALATTELCVNDLTMILDMEQSAVSHQLRTLKKWGLVRSRKEGRMVFYAIDNERTPNFFLDSLTQAHYHTPLETPS